MASKNSLKTYVEGGYYHIYNRGVNKMVIFIDQQDYGVFLSYLKNYLLPRDEKKLMQAVVGGKSTLAEKDKAIKQLSLNNFYENIDLLAYCLMPNHFHFLIKQKDERAIESFMKSMLIRYSAYFNKRHKRVGHVFQGRYKAVLVDTDPQLLHLTRYIHLNPVSKDSKGTVLERTVLTRTVQPSSYLNYLGKIKQDWVKPEFVLQNFSKSGTNSYQDFVESVDMDLENETVWITKDIILD